MINKTIAILLSVLPVLAMAQPKVSNLEANPAGKSIALTYNLSERADVSVYVSDTITKRFRRLPARYLQGDCGSGVKAGDQKRVLWNVSDQYPGRSYKGVAQFKVTARPRFSPFVLATGGFSITRDWSAGLMAGMCGAAGFYVKGNANFAANKQCDYTCGADGQIIYQGELTVPFYSEKQSVTNWMAAAGLMVRMYIPLYLYVGGGYGQRNLYWELTNGSWVNNTAGTYRGLTGDIGLMGNIKHFAISLGVSSINLKYTEIQVGLGYML